MKRTSIVTLLVFVGGLAIGYFARGTVGMLQREDKDAADLAAIEKLHRADVDATLTQDPNLLINLWSDDCVKLGVPGPAIVGKKGIQEVYGKFRAEHPDFKVLKYAPKSKMSKSRMAGRLSGSIMKPRSRCPQKTIQLVCDAKTYVC
jgi:hypothetical protein